MAYEAKLPPDVKLPDGYKIDTADERYKQLEAVATAHKWSQEAFTEVLGIEGRKVAAAHASARAAAPAPAKPDMSGRRPVVKGCFEAAVNVSGAVMSTAC
jgi:hypothetical protein